MLGEKGITITDIEIHMLIEDAVKKTARQAIASFFKKYGKSDEVSDSIAEIKELLERHIDEDKEFQESVAATTDIMMEFTRTQCRTVIKNIFTSTTIQKFRLYTKKDADVH